MSEKKKAIVVGESQSERYTEIEGRKSEALPECCVIAFRDDEWLRELIAAPRIIEIGFSSRAAEVSAQITPCRMPYQETFGKNVHQGAKWTNASFYCRGSACDIESGFGKLDVSHAQLYGVLSRLVS